MRSTNVTAIAVLAWMSSGLLAEEKVKAPIVVRSDSGLRGGHVDLEAIPSRGGTNSLKKRFTIEMLDQVRSARLLLFAARAAGSDGSRQLCL